MTGFTAEAFDVVVIGAGHAGIEAALAAARLGMHTACFTINLDAVGNMPCNPAIGGTAKGHLVREIDALGGEMARAADAACIQYRMLNRGKGPAVHSLRAQADRVRYRTYMKHALERQQNLRLMQDEVVADRGRKRRGQSAVVTAIGARHPAKAVIVASGTFLGGRIIIGDYTRESGPDGHGGGGAADRLAAQPSACACSASKPARRRASTAARSTFPASRCSRGRRRSFRSRLRPTTRRATRLCAT